MDSNRIPQDLWNLTLHIGDMWHRAMLIERAFQKRDSCPVLEGRGGDCPTRMVWQEAVFDRLKPITLADLIERACGGKTQELNKAINHPIIAVIKGKR